MRCTPSSVEVQTIVWRPGRSEGWRWPCTCRSPQPAGAPRKSAGWSAPAGWSPCGQTTSTEGGGEERRSGRAGQVTQAHASGLQLGTARAPSSPSGRCPRRGPQAAPGCRARNIRRSLALAPQPRARGGRSALVSSGSAPRPPGHEAPAGERLRGGVVALRAVHVCC